jgi:acyl-CoA dehydrogenase
MLNTINYCKFNLGFGAIGLCTHALYESIDHAANRTLFDHRVTDFPQVKRLFTDAFCRLVAMKMFSYRATDYMRSASAEDRRYLLFNPIVKMKVTMEGEKVIDELWDVIAAKGFEAEPFFEIAAVEIRSLPKLEGTAHVNMALIVKFMQNYLFAPADYPQIPLREDLADDTFLFRQGPTRGLGKIRFHDYRETYDRFDLPNIEVFKKQIKGLRKLLMIAKPDKAQSRDLDYLLTLGELFTLVVYGHLILEKALMDETGHDLLNQMFGVFVRDFSGYATELYSKPSNSGRQRKMIRKLIKAPVADMEQFERVWREHIFSLNGQYSMGD